MRYLATFLFVLQVGFGGGIRGPLQSFAPAAITATIINDGKYNAFPGLVRLPSGRLVVIYRAGTNHSAANDGVLKYQTSTDSGATWSSAGSVYTPVYVAAFDRVSGLGPLTLYPLQVRKSGAILVFVDHSSREQRRRFGRCSLLRGCHVQGSWRVDGI